jgi:hypothetical protein
LIPEPQKLLKWLHENNVKVNLNLHPANGVGSHEECYEAFAQFMGMDPNTKRSIEFNETSQKVQIEH